jgi:hypothetical protein
MDWQEVDFGEQRLFRVAYTFKQSVFEIVEAALETKYGKPTSTTTQDVKNGFGAHFNRSTVAWKNGVSTSPVRTRQNTNVDLAKCVAKRNRPGALGFRTVRFCEHTENFDYLRGKASPQRKKKKFCDCSEVARVRFERWAFDRLSRQILPRKPAPTRINGVSPSESPRTLSRPAPQARQFRCSALFSHLSVFEHRGLQCVLPKAAKGRIS